MLNRVQNRLGSRSGRILLLSASMLSGCAVGPNYHSYERRSNRTMICNWRLSV
jgi:hypothetical protein